MTSCVETLERSRGPIMGGILSAVNRGYERLFAHRKIDVRPFIFTGEP